MLAVFPEAVRNMTGLRHRTSDGWLALRANKPAEQDKHGQRDPYGRGGIQARIDQDTIISVPMRLWVR